MNYPGERLAGLTPQQRSVLEQRLLSRSPQPKQVERSNQPLPLSFSQESLWFLDQLLPRSPLYTIPQAFRLRGFLNRQALESALGEVIHRHDALRTRFLISGTQPMQKARESAPFSLPFVDLGDLSAQQQQQESRLILEREAATGFDLTGEILLRALLVRCGPEEHLLIVNLHHMISDHGSLGILFEEISVLYDAFLEQRKSPLAPLPVQFPDLAAFQRKKLEETAFSGQLDYWVRQLSGKPTPPELPLDFSRPKHQTYQGARRSVHLPSTLGSALKDLGQKCEASLYMVLLAIFQTLLHRYSNQDDIIVGAPMGGRDHPGSEKLIGFFVNTLPLRTDLSGDPSFTALLRRVREVALAAYSHQKVPLEKLIESLHLPRDSGRHPLCPVIFQFLPSPSPVPQLRGIVAEVIPLETGTSKFDLTFTLAQCADGLRGDIEFNTDIFKGATIDRLISHFTTLAGAVAANPEELISKLPLAGPAERQQLIVDWNQTETNYPRQQTVHRLFEEQALATPSAVAVVSDERSLSYRELNEQANQLARYLQRAGIGNGMPVGVCLERSMDLVVTLLAILKAGGCYVPFDVHYPSSRISYMIEDSGASVVITSAAWADRFPATTRTIPLDAQKRAIEEETSSNLEMDGAPANPAYIIYTSGSTGRPKGVVVPHRGIVRLVRETNYVSFRDTDVFLQFAPVSFDASTFEIWGSLLNGAKLVLFPPEFESLQQLEEIIRRHQVTTLWLTAGLFHYLVDHRLNALQPVRQLLAGGDVLSVPHVLKVLAAFPNCQLINGYGPTENTTFTCCHRIPPDWPGGRSVPIGKPISNTTVYILDRHRQPVPIGVPGDLYIGGDGLALEYLHSPELTAARFLPHPFDSTPGARIYQTGDRARFLADGTIEFLGRLDDQVKIRGFRIELAEIETVLAESPLVQAAAVLARASDDGVQTLEAHIVAQPGRDASPAEFREFLAAKLPGYMVPSRFILLDRLPITANGKVDRAALRETATGSVTAPSPVAPPQNETESRLLAIWKELLKIEHLGVRDNFFEVGGHSLLATRVVLRADEIFQVSLSLTDLFEFPTVAGLAQRILSHKKREAIPAIKPRARLNSIARTSRASDIALSPVLEFPNPE